MDRITDKQELLKLIQAEIDLGFTCLDISRLSSRMGQSEQASRTLQNAKVAWEIATRFLDRLPEEEASRFRSGLRELESALKKSLIVFQTDPLPTSHNH